VLAVSQGWYGCHAGAVAAETEQVRARRHYRRALFDGVADRYLASRRGYPAGSIQLIIDTARARPGSAVLEVGCGTGQLTGQLAARGLAVTAIDIDPSMITAARRHLRGSPVSFQVVSFEELDAPEASFDLIISATAFHWLDPDVKFVKAARLLRAGGWLALLNTEERYDDPLGSDLRDMSAARTGGDAWARPPRPPAADLTGAAGLFGPPLERSYSQPIVLPAQTVIGVETTRATFLSWPAPTQQDFAADLRRRLQHSADVHLTQQTSLAIAQVLTRERRPS
jgi:SAM-dependent methyltransferase